MGALTVCRLTKAAYAATAFAGSRGRGRWHRAGTPAVYAADHAATALVETLVHAGSVDLLTAPYVLFRITLDEDRHLLRLPEAALPPGWEGWPWPETTQALGTLWFDRADSPVLEVPCAVVPVQRTYVLNPRHAAFGELEISGPEPFPIDPRLGRR